MKAWSARYWESRYANGGTSGIGSRGELARYKARVVNSLAEETGAETAIEFGCGDGVQLGLFRFRDYLGLDPSHNAIAKCLKMYSSEVPNSKRFLLLEYYRNEQADVSLSLDVIYHLVEDGVFDQHLKQLFSAATKLVVVYSSDFDGQHVKHQRPRAFQHAVEALEPGWRLWRKILNEYPYDPVTGNGSLSTFYAYVPVDAGQR